MKSKSQEFFWPSFSDLMSSLFFIMLVLYLLTFLTLKFQKRATEAQLKKIKDIEQEVRQLPAEYFVYDTTYKRYVLNRDIHFALQKTNIDSSDRHFLEMVGGSIRDLIDTLKTKYAGEDIRYVVIIEGMASKDPFPDNFPLSYRRALAVKRVWDSSRIVLDSSVCEVQIAGSGTEGLGRDTTDESKNQRILIQIVPKIGKLN